MKESQMLWGYYTWLLFHTLAEKRKESEFEHERANLLYFIKKICSVLPCPDCSDHAMHLLKHYDYNYIKTKKDFQLFLFEFHNIVNKRKRLKVETSEVLNVYKKALLYKIITVWDEYFVVKGFNSKIITNNIQRNVIKKQFIKYIQFNKHKFDD
mgnify:FL=1